MHVKFEIGSGTVTSFAVFDDGHVAASKSQAGTRLDAALARQRAFLFDFLLYTAFGEGRPEHAQEAREYLRRYAIPELFPSCRA